MNIYVGITTILCVIILLKYKYKMFYLSNIYYLLNKMEIKQCNKSINLPCIDYICRNNITNYFNFISNKIQAKYIKSSFTLINSKYFVYKRISKSKNICKKDFYLKIHGFKNVILSSEGSVHSDCWNLTIRGGCKCSYIPQILVKKSLYKQYDKVVSIAHHWCNAVYHSIGECLPKLGYYIPELLKDKSIKIHAMKSASIKYLNFLGFNNSRIIYGNVYARRLIILGKGSCGSPPPIIQLNYLRNYLRLRIKPKPKYDIVLIKRYGKREIINFSEVYKTLNDVYKNKSIVIFYPNTTFDNTLNYFKYAKLIVGPHGAGISNIIVSDSNCILIEFYNKNLCLSSLAKNLGLEYYGIYENISNGKFNINISRFKNVLKIINDR